MDAWVIYKLEAGEVRYVCACTTLAAAKAQVEHALPDGQWLHGYRHIWDYMVERSPHRKAVAFRVQLQAVPDGGSWLLTGSPTKMSGLLARQVSRLRT